MKKNMIIFATVLVALVVILAFVVNYQNSQKSADNPYEKDNLEQATIDQLDDPDYGNQILPDELEEEVQSGDPVTVYFYSPECQYCRETTPDLVPLAQDMNVDMKKMNLLEFESEWNKYSIESTPTVVHYEDGEEQDRIVGAQSMEEFESFFEENAGE
ncbi:thioredoxin [Halobacillus andaensis]|uniref:Thioredoxin n=1 Tax=Halobacillus andaensis TaxID=1176239 RepID=A0A917EWE3_HALAA|nr:thioredoxin family protein [Halobacillus andaensis]MBP2004116.1 thiol-disulfide isomerase/thioredoxin [Halobacillus andaensis]GGF15931.1 thioredoxin [Halobacillus andaensis]